MRHINSLPIEIIRHVLAIACDLTLRQNKFSSRREQRRVVSHGPKEFALTAFFVCHLWKDLISSTSTLWVSSIVLMRSTSYAADWESVLNVSRMDSLQELQSFRDARADIDLCVSNW